MNPFSSTNLHVRDGVRVSSVHPSEHAEPTIVINAEASTTVRQWLDHSGGPVAQVAVDGDAGVFLSVDDAEAVALGLLEQVAKARGVTPLDPRNVTMESALAVVGGGS